MHILRLRENSRANNKQQRNKEIRSMNDAPSSDLRGASYAACFRDNC